MLSNVKARTVRPCLETLEDRTMPSFLLGGTVAQMAAPLAKIVADMKTTRNDLNQAIQGIKTSANGSTQQGMFSVVAVSDLQRLRTEQQAIKSLSTTDQAFINAAAMAEFQTGDALDLVVLFFGKAIGIDPVKTVQDPLNQANTIMNGQDVQGDISFMTNNAKLFNISDVNYTQAPSF